MDVCSRHSSLKTHKTVVRITTFCLFNVFNMRGKKTPEQTHIIPNFSSTHTIDGKVLETKNEDLNIERMMWSQWSSDAVMVFVLCKTHKSANTSNLVFANFTQFTDESWETRTLDFQKEFQKKHDSRCDHGCLCVCGENIHEQTHPIPIFCVRDTISWHFLKTKTLNSQKPI